MNKTETKAFTLKAVALADIEKFNDLKDKKQLTQAGTLAFLLDSDNTYETQGLLDGLRKTVEELEKVNQELTTVNQALEAEKTNLTILLEKETALKTEAVLMVDDLQAKGAEIKEVPIPLTGNQFICEPNGEVMTMIRKYRPFLKKDGIITSETTDEDFPTKLFEISVKRYLGNRYE